MVGTSKTPEGSHSAVRVSVQKKFGIARGKLKNITNYKGGLVMTLFQRVACSDKIFGLCLLYSRRPDFRIADYAKGSRRIYMKSSATTSNQSRYHKTPSSDRFDNIVYHFV